MARRAVTPPVEEEPEVEPAPIPALLVGATPVGDDLWVVMVDPQHLREQAMNAQMMTPRKFQQLVDNIRDRGQLESLPYCTCPGGVGEIEIISGHHRVRAALAAGLDLIPILLDTSGLSRSALVAKQIAHNALVGESDSEILRRMIDTIDDPDQLLATGLDPSELPLPPPPNKDFLGPPAVDFAWRNVAFTFLPHQLRDFVEVLDALDGTQDLVGAVPADQFAAFAQTVASYSRIRDIRSTGTAVHLLVQLAQRELDLVADTGDAEGWVPLADILGTARVPSEVAAVLVALIDKLLASGDITENAKWRALELAAADLLAGP